MKGYILNLTIRGQGVVKNQGQENLFADRVIFCCSRQERFDHYGRHPEAREWYHQWVYFRARAYWHEWLNWPSIFANTVFFARMKRTSRISATCSGKSLTPGKGKGAIRSCWR
ncbi:AraC family ligand binding domain-containing protein [Escherichia coli]